MSHTIWNNLEQGTPEWKAWRNRGIGGSDAADILGIGYNTVWQLLGYKLGVAWIQPTFAMRRGQRLEEPARRWACQQLNEQFIPKCGECHRFRWMRTSLDGINKDGTQILEIKAPKESYHADAVFGSVPDQYKAQLQHNLLVTGADLCWYVSITESSAFNASKEWPQFALTHMTADKEYQAKLLAAEQDFYDYWQQAASMLDVMEIDALRTKWHRVVEVEEKHREPHEAQFWAEWDDLILPLLGLSV